VSTSNEKSNTTMEWLELTIV